MLPSYPTVPETGSVEAYGDRVIVRRIPPDEKVGSIFIPEDASRVGQHSYKTRLCEVVSVGHKRLKNGKTIPLSVSPGDRIVMSIYKGKEFPVVGEELVAISEDDILCVLQPSEEN